MANIDNIVEYLQSIMSEAGGGELNRDDKLRQELMGISAKYSGGIYSFRDMSVGTFDALLKNGFIDLYGRLYWSPTIAQFRVFAEKYKDEDMRFTGYLVSPDREDYRVSIEGIVANSLNQQFMQDFKMLFMMADEFECRDGYQRCWFD